MTHYVIESLDTPGTYLTWHGRAEFMVFRHRKIAEDFIWSLDSLTAIHLKVAEIEVGPLQIDMLRNLRPL